MKRTYDSITIAKAIAVLLIVFTHCDGVFPIDISAGAEIGLALFFLISGFLFANSVAGGVRGIAFFPWIFKRIVRVYTPLIVYYSILLWDGTYKMESLSNFFNNATVYSSMWFCNFIILVYIVLYIIYRIRNSTRWNGNIDQIVLILGIIYLFIFVAIGKGETYPTHSATSKILWVIMALIGWRIYERKPETMGETKEVSIMIGLLAMYVISKYLNAMKLFYGVSLFPFLFGALFSIYCLDYLIVHEELCSRICDKRVLGNFISIIAELSLEVYIIQFVVIDRYTICSFPINIILIVTTTLLMALALHAFSNYVINVLFK